MIGSGLALVAPDGRVLRAPLPTSNPAHAATPSLSPDGSRIVFDALAFPLQLVVADADGANPRPITDDRRTAPATPVWSPRGHLIAFDVSGIDVAHPPPGLRPTPGAFHPASHAARGSAGRMASKRISGR